LFLAPLLGHIPSSNFFRSFELTAMMLDRLVLEERLERLVVPVAEVEFNGFLVAHAAHVHFTELFFIIRLLHAQWVTST